MEIHNLDSWEAFEGKVKNIDDETKELKESKQTTWATTSVIYRGQADSRWHLESTLERKLKKTMTVSSYFKLMLNIWNSPASTYKENLPNLEKEINNLNVKSILSFPTTGANSNQIISFMVHLRHYGFPSPLLDWTEDHLIAAFFAFENIPDGAEKIAIYTFRKYTGHIPDMGNIFEPIAIEIGHNIPGIERHENQQSRYTLCVRQDYNKDFKNAKFADTEKAINMSGFHLDSNGNEIDHDSVENVTKKFTIPVSERNKALKKLQTMGINRCFLFEETEDNRLSDCWNIILSNEQI